jgi:hypothetical protein
MLPSGIDLIFGIHDIKSMMCVCVPEFKAKRKRRENAEHLDSVGFS